MIQKLIDDLIKRFRETEYESNLSGRTTKLPILSDFSKSEEHAIRAVVSAWLQDHVLEGITETAVLKAKVQFYEECMRKSTFAPFVEPRTTEEPK